MIPYTLRHKRINKVTLRVHRDGTVAVSVPYGVPKAKVDEFVNANMAFIENARARLAAKLPPDGFARVAGRDVRLVVCRGRGAPYLDGDRLVLFVPDESDKAARERALLRFYRAECERLVSRYCAEMEPLFQITPTVVFRRMKARWGSCQPQSKTLTFNIFLATASDACVRYIVAHEFSHFRVPNHSPAFYRVLDEVEPNRKALRAELKRTGVIF